MPVHLMCLILCDPVDSSWNSLGQNTGVGSLSLLQGIFQPRVRTQVFCIAAGFFTSWATREALLMDRTWLLFFSPRVMSNSFATPYSLPGSSVHKILKARIQEWAAVLLQVIFLTQGSNLHLLYWQVGGVFLLFLPLSHQRSPRLAYPVTKTTWHIENFQYLLNKWMNKWTLESNGIK